MERKLLFSTKTHFISSYLVEFIENDCLVIIIIHFLADGVEIIFKNGDIQAEVKLQQIVAEGEGRVANGDSCDVPHSASL